MPLSKRKAAARANVEQAPHVKLARVRQAAADHAAEDDDVAAGAAIEDVLDDAGRSAPARPLRFPPSICAFC